MRLANSHLSWHTGPEAGLDDIQMGILKAKQIVPEARSPRTSNRSWRWGRSGVPS
jgi:hypothetical protein